MRWLRIAGCGLHFCRRNVFSDSGAWWFRCGEEAKLMKWWIFCFEYETQSLHTIGRFLTVLEALCCLNRLRTWRLRSQIQRNGHHLRRSCGWSLTRLRLGHGEKQCKSRERKPPTSYGFVTKISWSHSSFAVELWAWGSGGWSWTGRTASDSMGNLWSILSGTLSGPHKREGLKMNVTWWCLEVSPLAWRRFLTVEKLHLLMGKATGIHWITLQNASIRYARSPVTL